MYYSVLKLKKNSAKFEFIQEGVKLDTSTVEISIGVWKNWFSSISHDSFYVVFHRVLHSFDSWIMDLLWWCFDVLLCAQA
jgi:hypothetical protein